jgi:hypothetical protein
MSEYNFLLEEEVEEEEEEEEEGENDEDAGSFLLSVFRCSLVDDSDAPTVFFFKLVTSMPKITPSPNSEIEEL